MNKGKKLVLFELVDRLWPARNKFIVREARDEINWNSLYGRRLRGKEDFNGTEFNNE